MGTGAITTSIDVAQIVLYTFWAFFFGLVVYLVREGHREGYPMDSDAGGAAGWLVPPPKTFKLQDGTEVQAPRPLSAESMGRAQMEPLYKEVDSAVGPVGNPLLAGVGPGAWNARVDRPDRDVDGHLKVRPLSALPDFGVSGKDPDPRGKPLVDAYGDPAGVVRDLWLDVPEMLFRYLEAEVPVPGGASRRVLVPVPFARIGREAVQVHALLAGQFADVPGTRAPDEVTRQEEERIAAYYGAGTLYAEPSRAEPII